MDINTMIGKQSWYNGEKCGSDCPCMEVRIDMDFFDNFEDGQLSMFDMAESLENLQTPAEEKVSDAEPLPASGSAGIRIRNCSSCGKLLFVKEEDGCYVSACNACGIHYIQKM